MKKLDRLPWIDGFVVTGYGVRVGVRVDDAALLPLLRERLPPGARISTLGVVDRMLSVRQGRPSTRPGIRNYKLLYADHVVAVRSHDLDDVFESYDTHVQIAMAQYARPKLFVHAGVVAWKGRAILLPGSSRAGKTHLVAELVAAGAAYFSDEYAILDRNAVVHPFPKPLSLRAHNAARQRHVPVGEIGGIAGRKPLPVGLVIMCHYEQGARWQPQRLTPGAGVLELLSNTFAARHRPEQAMAILEQVALRALVLKSTRGDARSIAHEILSTCATLSLSDRSPVLAYPE
ncbi:MAG: hypothetical protein ABJF01_22715 [bacterium]